MNDLIKTPVPERVAKINAEIAASPLAAQGISVAPSAITSESLKPITPLNIPTPTQSTTTAGIIGATDAKITGAYNDAKTAYDTALEDYRTSAKTEAESGKNKVLDFINQKISILGQKTDLQAKANVPELEKLSREAYNELQSSKQAQLQELNSLKNSGASDVQVASANREITNRYAVQNAALSTSYDIANRNYLAAEKSVEDKIKALNEPIDEYIKFYSSFLSSNEQNLNEAEKARITALKDDAEREKTKVADEQKAIYEIMKSAQEAGADFNTINSIGNSGSKEEALSKVPSQFAGGLAGVKGRLEIQKLNREIQALGVSTITNPQAGQYAGALNVILGSGKFTKEQKASVINSVNNGEDPFTVIKNQAKNLMGTEAKDLRNTEIALDQIDKVDSLLTQYYANGGKTSYLSGSYESVINKLGEVNDPKLVMIATQISSAIQQYRNAVSGTAYSVKEGQQIDSIFPGINKSEGLNKAIISGRKQAFNDTIDSTYRNALGSTYDELKKAQNAAVDPLNIGIDLNNNPLGI